MPHLPHGRWRWVVIAAGVVLAGVAIAVVVQLRSQRDISNSDVEFVETAPPTPTQTVPSTPPRRHPADDGFAWPLYGYDKPRTHVLPLARELRPPFRPAWAVRGSVLLEFTPVLCGRSLFLLKNNGALYRISRTTGRVIWKRKLGVLAASSPACGGGSVYALLLQRGKGVKGGRIVAIRQRSGRTRWSRKLASRAESSPLLDRGRVIFGSEDGTVYNLNAHNGSIRWQFKASGAVKGAVALADGKLYFGDYSGRVYAIRRRDGRKVWTASGSGSGFGGAGRFYSTPAIAYGRVYIGNVDGNVYSFSSRDGKLAWRTGTGDYVYASPAVGQVAGGPPTVWIGSYDGKFYALNARTGGKRWTRSLGRKISGSASVIGDLVFVSDLGTKSSWALGANTGKTVWKTHRGAFNPAISDGRRIYFNGYSSLFGLDPSGVHFRRARSR
ncbi:MAG: PQQ-binding-like beta-propeller repeat protein [Solirubrobacteraceae bacterium]|nr:PQQ-binding-like beta-propeller repeat protein [Solirubrobacteraceae bacterium]